VIADKFKDILNELAGLKKILDKIHKDLKSSFDALKKSISEDVLQNLKFSKNLLEKVSNTLELAEKQVAHIENIVNNIADNTVQVRKELVDHVGKINSLLSGVSSIIKSIGDLKEFIKEKFSDVSSKVTNLYSVLQRLENKLDNFADNLSSQMEKVASNIARLSSETLLFELDKNNKPKLISSLPVKLAFDKKYLILYKNPMCEKSQIRLNVYPEELDAMIIHENEKDIINWMNINDVYAIKFTTVNPGLRSLIRHLRYTLRGTLTISYRSANSEITDVVIPVELKTRSLTPIIIGLVPILIGLWEFIIKIVSFIGVSALPMFSIVLILAGAIWIGTISRS